MFTTNETLTKTTMNLNHSDVVDTAIIDRLIPDRFSSLTDRLTCGY